ncbi:MAG: hypothetical protein M0C28_22105 [Candidatus Moduliflexus flocculans]|nr:hypothetical protein [Candidatus Moduliflexus flocculans]
MICDRCGKREASVFIRREGSGESALCGNCAREQGISAEDGRLQISLEDLFRLPQDLPDRPGYRSACSVCGTRLEEVRKSGRVGCPARFESFRAELVSFLQRRGAGAPTGGACPGGSRPPGGYPRDPGFRRTGPRSREDRYPRNRSARTREAACRTRWPRRTTSRQPGFGICCAPWGSQPRAAPRMTSSACCRLPRAGAAAHLPDSAAPGTGGSSLPGSGRDQAQSARAAALVEEALGGADRFHLDEPLPGRAPWTAGPRWSGIWSPQGFRGAGRRSLWPPGGNRLSGAPSTRPTTLRIRAEATGSDLWRRIQAGRGAGRPPGRIPGLRVFPGLGLYLRGDRGLGYRTVGFRDRASPGPWPWRAWWTGLSGPPWTPAFPSGGSVVRRERLLGALYELETPRGAWTDEESILVRLGDAVERISAYEKGAREELLLA